jgi:hypothetical protein
LTNLSRCHSVGNFFRFIKELYGCYDVLIRYFILSSI